MINLKLYFDLINLYLVTVRWNQQYFPYLDLNQKGIYQLDHLVIIVIYKHLHNCMDHFYCSLLFLLIIIH